MPGAIGCVYGGGAWGLRPGWAERSCPPRQVLLRAPSTGVTARKDSDAPVQTGLWSLEELLQEEQSALQSWEQGAGVGEAGNWERGS